MRPEEVKNWLKREPFVPFRMVLSNGRTFEVQHPEMIMVGRTWSWPMTSLCLRTTSRSR
jgi:hypothetical protein